jgi:hypothetical protein
MCRVHDDFKFILPLQLIEILTGHLGAKQAPLISSVRKWSTFLFVGAAILQSYVVRPLHAQSLAETARQSETAHQSIVDIYYDVVDPKPGAKSTIQGTGFVVSQKGLVLTASYLFRLWLNQRDIDRKNNPIRGKLSFAPELSLNLEVISVDPDNEDIAFLRLPDPAPQTYSTAAICFSRAAAIQPGDVLLAFGFPFDQDFEGVPVTLETQNAAGGRWEVASGFNAGMTGGPVYSREGFVVGLVTGALDAPAVRWLTPLQRAANWLRDVGLVERCPTIQVTDVAPPEKSAVISYTGIIPNGFPTKGRISLNGNDLILDTVDPAAKTITLLGDSANIKNGVNLIRSISGTWRYWWENNTLQYFSDPYAVGKSYAIIAAIDDL